MALLPVIFIIAALVYACRWMGFALTIAQPPVFYRRFLKFVPVTAFTVLIVMALFRQPVLLQWKIAALVLAGTAIRVTRNPGVSFVVGLVSLWMLAGIRQ